MSDIVDRLRGRVHVRDAAELLHSAADEITRLRESIRRLAEQDATLAVQGGNVTVTMDGTLTDEEREAVSVAMHRCDGPEFQTLRKLLERLA